MQVLGRLPYLLFGYVTKIFEDGEVDAQAVEAIEQVAQQGSLRFLFRVLFQQCANDRCRRQEDVMLLVQKAMQVGLNRCETAQGPEVDCTVEALLEFREQSLHDRFIVGKNAYFKAPRHIDFGESIPNGLEASALFAKR